MDNSQSVSIILPVHNGGEKFRQCLKSIKNSDLAPHEVIVVTDGSLENDREIAQSFDVRILATPFPPRGPARARNVGAQAANGDILLFIDADVTLHRDCMGLVVAFFQENPCVPAVFGTYDNTPFEPDFFSQYKNLFHRYTHQNAHAHASTFWGACGAVKRNVFFKIGAFDERFTRPSIEDIELGYRLTKAGYHIRLLKNLQVKHLKHWDFKTLLKTDILHRAIPWTRLLQQQEIPRDLNLKIKDRISCALVFIVVAGIPLTLEHPWVRWTMLLIMLVLLGANQNLYRYFFRLRGGWFAFKSIFFHWFYLFYSGVAFLFVKFDSCIKGCPLQRPFGCGVKR